MVEHTFGGPWTEEKLTRLRKYLEAYTVIFSRNPNAAYFHRVYVDAFAGTGLRSRALRSTEEAALPMFEEDADAESFMKGSAQIALEIRPPFHEYLFVEKDPTFAKELESLRRAYPTLASTISVKNGDANEILVNWTRRSNWQVQRAVVFLDPYGMQVNWSTLQALAATEAIDLWLLFPLGQAVNRLLTRSALPSEAWADRLTAMFGTGEWRDAFYQVSPQRHLFNDEPQYEKDASFDSIEAFFLKQLGSIFAQVAPKPLVLKNSRNNPIFLLCFAAANEKGAPTAVKIARDLLEG